MKPQQRPQIRAFFARGKCRRCFAISILISLPPKKYDAYHRGCDDAEIPKWNAGFVRELLQVAGPDASAWNNPTSFATKRFFDAMNLMTIFIIGSGVMAPWPAPFLHCPASNRIAGYDNGLPPFGFRIMTSNHLPTS